jgi:multisubunit Na+/H+ antiporter MnhE subunit
MANTWGELTWGAGSFGLQNDASVPITGNLLTVTPGTATAGIGQQISVTGNSLTLSDRKSTRLNSSH